MFFVLFWVYIFLSLLFPFLSSSLLYVGLWYWIQSIGDLVCAPVYFHLILFLLRLL